MVTVTDGMVETYQREGVVLVRGLFADWVEMLRAGVARNLASPSQPMPTLKPGEPGRFFDDYCNWSRIPEFAAVIRQSEAAEVAGRLMGSERVQLFHDHVLVKEPGTAKPTPWHTDGPYYFVEGRQTVSFWVPLDPVKKASLRCVAGSHLWPKDVLPTRWMSETDFYPGEHDYMPVPDPEAEGMAIREWRWSRAMRWPSTSAPFTGRGATLRRPGGGRSPSGWWGTTRAMWSGLGRPRPPFPATGCRRESGCGRTGFRSCVPG
jgi:hypothetical protein